MGSSSEATCLDYGELGELHLRRAAALSGMPFDEHRGRADHDLL